MSANSPPPGWYSDGQGRQRWWDGNAWFESVDSASGEGAQNTQILNAGSEQQEMTPSGSPSGRRNKGGHPQATLLAKSPTALMILGCMVAIVGIIALLVVDPTCLNNEECGALRENFWTLFARGIILTTVGLLLAVVGFVWYRRSRRSPLLGPDSAESASTQSDLPGRTLWYRRWWGVALLAIPIIAAVGIAVGLSLNDDAGSASPQASNPQTADPLQAEDLAAEDEATQLAEEEAEAERQAEAEAKAEAELRNPKSYKSISHRKWAQVAKDPDSYVGKKYVLYGYVTQFDSATGNDSFLVSTDAVPHAWYDYDINTIATTDKPKRFRKVVEDDLVKMYVVVGGSISYDTQIGGNTTVPSVVVNIIKVTGSGG